MSLLSLGPLVIPYPDFDPIALQIGWFSLRWYGLAYMAGLLLGWLYVRHLLAQPRLWPGGPPLMPDDADNLLLWTTFGVIVGGRLGSVLLYEPSYYFQNPLEILAVWKGGMAFHGGLIGCGVVAYLFARAHRISAYTVMDLMAAAVPIGLFFGRIANFINGELWGRATDVSWAMVFPDPAAGGIPRHPSQLYEAASEGALLFLLIYWLIHYRTALAHPGRVTGTFLIGYGIARSVCELFREFDTDLALALPWFTPGMAYSLPMIVLGIVFLMSSGKRSVHLDDVAPRRTR